MTNPLSLGESLCSALHCAPAMQALQSCSEEDWRQIVQLARRLSLAPLLLERLKLSGAIGYLPEGVKNELHKQFALSMHESIRRQEQIAQLLDAFGEAKIDLVALKGLDLAYQFYSSPAIRQMQDLDILVRSQDVPRCRNILLGIGYRDDIPDAQVHKIFYHILYLPPYQSNGLGLELHWDLSGVEMSGKYQPDALWEHLRKVNILGRGVYALSLENTILHLCMHTAFNHQFMNGLKACCDLDQCLQTAGDGLDWNLVLQQARLWGLFKPVALMLNLAVDLLGVAVPPAVLAELSLQNPKEKQAYQQARRLALQRDLVHLPGDFHGWRSMAKILTAKGWGGKIKSALQVIFPPRWVIVRRYGAISFPWLPLYYLKNLWDDSRLQGPRVIKFLRTRAVRVEAAPKPDTAALWQALQEDQEIQDALMDWMMQRG